MLELSTFGSVGGAAGNCRLYPAKAARGATLLAKSDKRIYAWEGDQDPNRANVAETGIGSTCAVGIFPSGASPYGCLDMIGNVWEWTQSKWKDYPYEAKDGREKLEGNDSRVLRGGAWGSNWYYARAACRGRPNPDGRYNDIGFRVVVAPNSRS